MKPKKPALFRNVVLALLALLGGCEEVVRFELTESQAFQAQVRLEAAGIPARVERGSAGWELKVARDRGREARRLLLASGLGGGDSDPGGGSGGIFPSPAETRYLVQRARARELERAIEVVDGVVEAVVVLDGPRPSAGPKVVDAASVLVKVMDGSRPPLDEGRLKSFVAGGLSGLEPGAVQVVFTGLDWNEPSVSDCSLAELGPFRVDEQSLGSLRLLLVGGALLLALLAATVALLAWRLVRITRKGTAPVERS